MLPAVSLVLAAAALVGGGGGRAALSRVAARPRAAVLSVATPSYGGIQHAGVLVKDTEASLKFYTEVFGMGDDTHLRPDLPYAGAFVRAGAHQIHLMQLPNPDPVDGRPEHGGRDRHVALTIESIEPLRERLDAAGVAHTMSKSGRAALFCRDPDGNAFEFMEATAVRA